MYLCGGACVGVCLCLQSGHTPNGWNNSKSEAFSSHSSVHSLFIGFHNYVEIIVDIPTWGKLQSNATSQAKDSIILLLFLAIGNRSGYNTAKNLEQGNWLTFTLILTLLLALASSLLLSFLWLRFGLYELRQPSGVFFIC